MPVPSPLARTLAGLLLAACAASGCELIAGIHDLHPPDGGGPTDVGADALTGDAPLDAPAMDAEAPDGPDDGAADDAAPVDTAPGPDCSAAICPNGCCANNGACIVNESRRCGRNGVGCVWCDEERTDGCDNDGNCACGGNPPCTGSYYCGGGVCDFCGTTTCANGCCSSLTCVRQPTFPTCGVSGGSCRSCDTVLSDGCLDGGDCGCGGAAQCQVGQTCGSSGCEL